jgi:predicted nucleic acid-binding protein
VSRVLVDTNIVLDVLLDRLPHAAASAGVWKAIENGAAEGYLAAHAVTTIEYIVGRELSRTATRRILSRILRVFRVAAVDHAVIQDALQSRTTDFEDAVSAAAARAAGCGWIVTRDPKGFAGSTPHAVTPEAALALIAR